MALDMTYDPEADALYIRLSDERPVEGADAGPFVLDYNAANKLVGLELLSASTVLAPGDWMKAPRPTVGRDGPAVAAK
ncbi:MAG: DUF2283 domain-containing protein [Brevundimonas sp.]|uniref:DUF2283 domain-containing protein n=1 Tax=Brevundimonas sp. TaxID=1871086 RepID=UPI0027239488|nr:DUF2283 domain-containing protein [Brevundimonas sp.]MDO9076892.1 DUF2283 domain-containing protein [Brevundimonas sp.]